MDLALFKEVSMTVVKRNDILGKSGQEGKKFFDY